MGEDVGGGGAGNRDWYAEFKRVNDPTLDPGNPEVLTRLVTRLNLPPETTQTNRTPFSTSFRASRHRRP